MRPNLICRERRFQREDEQIKESKSLHKGPFLLFDNDCGICTRFAQFAESASRRWLRPVGLHTEQGARIKSSFFVPTDRPDEMFWVLLGDLGFGGRSGLLHLLREIVRGRIM